MTRPFAVVIVAGTLYFLSVGVVAPVLPVFVSSDLHGGNLAVGLVVGAFAIAAVVARPTAGRLCTRFGARSLIASGAAVAAVSIAAYGLCDNHVELFALRLATGVGEGFFFTGATTLVADLAPANRRGAALSLFSVTVFLGAGVGPLLGVPFADSVGAPWTFVVAGCIGAASAVACLFTVDVSPRRAVDDERLALVNRKAVGPGLAMALNCMGAAGFFAYIPLYAKDVDASVQTVFVIYAVIILGIRIGAAGLPDRLGPAVCGVYASVLDAAGLLVVAAFGSSAGLYVGAALFAVGTALLYPALMALTLSRGAAAERSSLVGTFTASFDVGQGLGGLVLGGVAAGLGLRESFAAGGVFALLGLLAVRRRPVQRA
jgi:MFS family permease